MLSLADSALNYAANGFKVFPCRPGTKIPLTEHGVLDATDNVEAVEAWWKNTPDANIGLSTAGLMALDVDGKENPWLNSLNGQAMDLASCPMSLTPRGGVHYLWKQPEGKKWRNTAGRIADHVDTRANGGYIVAPPSVLPQGEYCWAESRELDCAPEGLPEPPDWMTHLLDQIGQQAAEPVIHAGNSIPNGQRNVALTRIAGGMRRQGMTREEIYAALSVVNSNRCQTPLPDCEVGKVATSISHYGPDQVTTAMVEAQFEQMPSRQDEQPYVSVRQLIQDFPKLREPVIQGLLRQGETMNLISAPKIGKSWLVTNLALSIVKGRDWLGFPVIPGEVLILDNELHAETLANRIPKVASALGLNLDEYADRLHVRSFRGQLRDLFSLGSYFKAIEPGKFKLIICDALYRFFPPRTDENDNGTMANLYNTLDSYAAHTGASFVLIHHSTKGLQSGKAVTDVGAGAGAQGRAADAHVILRRHQEEDGVVLDAEVRSWPKIEPRCLRWQFPLWVPAEDLDPKNLKVEAPKNGRPHKPKIALPDFVAQFIPDTDTPRSQIIASAQLGEVGRQHARDSLNAAVMQGLVHETQSKSPIKPTLYRKVKK